MLGCRLHDHGVHDICPARHCTVAAQVNLATQHPLYTLQSEVLGAPRRVLQWQRLRRRADPRPGLRPPVEAPKARGHRRVHLGRLPQQVTKPLLPRGPLPHQLLLIPRKTCLQSLPKLLWRRIVLWPPLLSEALITRSREPPVMMSTSLAFIIMSDPNWLLDSTPVIYHPRRRSLFQDWRWACKSLWTFASRLSLLLRNPKPLAESSLLPNPVKRVLIPSTRSPNCKCPRTRLQRIHR